MRGTKKAKNALSGIAPWVVVAALGVGGLNVLLNLVGASAGFDLSGLLIALGFFAIIFAVYAENGLKFRSRLDLTLFGVLVAVLMFVAVSSTTLIPQIPVVSQIFSGLFPLLIGAVAGGVITLLIGFVIRPKRRR